MTTIHLGKQCHSCRWFIGIPLRDEGYPEEGIRPLTCEKFVVIPPGYQYDEEVCPYHVDKLRVMAK